MKPSILKGTKAVADISNFDNIRKKSQVEIEQMKEENRTNGTNGTKEEPKKAKVNIPDGYKLVKIPEKSKRLNIVLTPEDYAKLKRVSIAQNKSMNQILTDYIKKIKE